MTHKPLRIWHEKNKRRWVQSEGAKQGERFTSALQVELQVSAKGRKWMLTSVQSDKIWTEAENETIYNMFWGRMFIDGLNTGSSFLTVVTWKMVFLVPSSQMVVCSYWASRRTDFLMRYLSVITVTLPLSFQYILLDWVMLMYVGFDFFYLQKNTLVQPRSGKYFLRKSRENTEEKKETPLC